MNTPRNQRRASRKCKAVNEGCLAFQLKETNAIIFGDNNHQSNLIKQDYAYHYILSLRLEGRCSIQAISTIMKRFDLSKASVGTISQYLTKVGSILPNTLKTNEDEIELVVFLSDEIFSKNIPILVTVEPISSAILKIELADSRKAEDWKKHWESLEENGYTALYLVSDEGKGLCSAQKEALADVFRQPDTYHAIAHRVGSLVKRLENAAYKAIEAEYNCYKKLNSARSENVINKRIEECEKSEENVAIKIELYENVNYIYNEITNELCVFDCNGYRRERKEAEDNMEESLKLLETLEHKQTTKIAGYNGLGGV